MPAERAGFVKLAVKQKFRPENEKPEAVMERLFNVLVRCGSWMNEQVTMKFITGKTFISGQTEKAEYEKQRDAAGLLYKMMIYAAGGAADKDIAEWNTAYRTGDGKTVMELDEIPGLSGFSYSREEFYKLADGSHDHGQMKSFCQGLYTRGFEAGF